MRKLIIGLLCLVLLAVPVCAFEEEIPPAPEEATDLMPPETESFAGGLWFITKNAVSRISPAVSEAAAVCLGAFAVVLLGAVMTMFPGSKIGELTDLVCTVAIGLLLLQPTASLIRLAVDTITEICEYQKLLLPVLTAGLAAQGGTASAAALYAGTAFFGSLMSTAVEKLLLPLVYVFLALAVAGAALGQKLLHELKDFVKWLMTWLLKTVLYVFTGFMAVTGVISGTTDAVAVKAAKLTISGVVPVVGGILSDASETVLVSAGAVKNAAGIYGLLVAAALGITPFLSIGYFLLKCPTLAGVLANLRDRKPVKLISDFSSAMGLLLGMTGAVCFLFFISAVCFMKGMN